MTREEKISKSMEGNNNAEKWSKEVVIELLQKMLNETTSCYYLNHLLFNNGLYPDWWKYIKDKFDGDKEVERIQARIEQGLEVSLVKEILEGKVRETSGIFTLKAKYGWQDKQVIQHEGNKVSIDLGIGT